jgi:hypothetical protein
MNKKNPHRIGAENDSRASPRKSGKIKESKK